MAEPKKICFVCLGNIVRSPLAEHLFTYLAEQAGAAERYLARSAGTSAWHLGEEPDFRMRRVAASYGLQYTGVACQFSAADLDRCDLVVVMDRENRAEVLRLVRTPQQSEKIHLLREFDPYGGPQADVPDPYYSGIEGFEEVYRVVERSLRGLLKALEDGKV